MVQILYKSSDLKEGPILIPIGLFIPLKNSKWAEFWNRVLYPIHKRWADYVQGSDELVNADSYSKKSPLH